MSNESLLDDDFLTVKQIQDICQLSYRKTLRLLEEGLKHYRFQKTIRVRRSDLEQYLRDHEVVETK